MSEPEAMAAGREDARRLRAKLAARADAGQCLVCGKPAKGRTVAGEQACLAHGAQPGHGSRGTP